MHGRGAPADGGGLAPAINATATIRREQAPPAFSRASNPLEVPQPGGCDKIAVLADRLSC